MIGDTRIRLRPAPPRGFYPRSAWELRRLEALVDHDVIELRPYHHAISEYTVNGITALKSSGAVEEASAWWDQRRRRARHYLRRVLTGNLPKHTGLRAKWDPQKQFRAPLARMAILLSAIVCWETIEDKWGQRLRAGLLRRIGLLADLAALPPELRAIAAEVAAGALSAAGPGSSGPLEQRLVVDAGLYWLPTGLRKAELVDDRRWVTPPAIAQSVSKHLTTGFAEVAALEAERHELLFRFSSESDVDYKRGEFKALAMNVIGLLAPGDPRRQHLALAVLGLVLYAREPGTKATWHVVDPRRLDEIEAMSDVPAELIEAVSEARRFPSPADLSAQHRLYWKAAEVVDRQALSAGKAVLAAAPAPPREGTASVPTAAPKIPARAPAPLGTDPVLGTPATPAIGYVLDLDDDRLHVVISGKRLIYGRWKRGGQMTKRHKSVKFLVALARDGVVPSIDDRPLCDLRSALERATDEGVTIRLDVGGYVLSTAVAVSDRLHRAVKGRSR